MKINLLPHFIIFGSLLFQNVSAAGIPMSQQAARVSLFEKLSQQKVKILVPIECGNQNHLPVELRFLNQGRRVMTSTGSEGLYSPPRLWELNPPGPLAIENPLLPKEKFGEISIGFVPKVVESTTDYQSRKTFFDLLSFSSTEDKAIDKAKDFFVFEEENYFTGRKAVEIQEWNREKKIYQRSHLSSSVSDVILNEGSNLLRPIRPSRGQNHILYFSGPRNHGSDLAVSSIQFMVKQKDKLHPPTLDLKSFADLPELSAGPLWTFDTQSIYNGEQDRFVLAQMKLRKDGTYNWSEHQVPFAFLGSPLANPVIQEALPVQSSIDEHSQKLIFLALQSPDYHRTYHLFSTEKKRLLRSFSEADLQSSTIRDHQPHPIRFIQSLKPNEIFLLRTENEVSDIPDFEEKSLNRLNLVTGELTQILKVNTPRNNSENEPSPYAIITDLKNEQIFLPHQKSSLASEYIAIDSRSGKLMQRLSFEPSEEPLEISASADRLSYVALVAMKSYGLKLKYFSAESGEVTREETFSQFTEGLFNETKHDIDVANQGGLCIENHFGDIIEADSNFERFENQASPENAVKEEYSAYPNPFMDEIKLKLKVRSNVDPSLFRTSTGVEELSVQVVALNQSAGQIILDQKLSFLLSAAEQDLWSVESLAPINTQTWRPGIYAVKIKFSDQVRTIKIRKR